MKLAYFDCFSGISGDMTLGALVDAGCDIELLRAELRGLQVPGWELSAEKVWKNGMAATCVKVKTEDQSKHRSLSTILEILQKSRLAPQVRERAAAIFTKLGEAEARVHDVPLERIHFHEVGAVDAIIDIVGACIGFHALGIEKFVCSALNVGGGTAKIECRRRNRKNVARSSASPRARDCKSAARQAYVLQWSAKGTRHSHRCGHRRDAVRFIWPSATHECYSYRLRSGYG